MIRSRLMLSRGGLGFLGAFGVLVLTLGGACGGSSSATPDAGTGAGGAGHGGAGTGGAGHGGGGAGTGGAITGTPVELCNQFAKTICMRLNACPGVLADPTTFDEADCEKKNKVGIGCDRATSAGFKDCLQDVTSLSCSGLFSPTQGVVLPASCDDPLNIDLSTAQKKCADLALADCSRFFECSGIAATADDLSSCQAEDYSFIGCAFATDVGTTFDQCKLEISNAPCTSADGGTSADAGAPASTACDNAITFVQ